MDRVSHEECVNHVTAAILLLVYDRPITVHNIRPAIEEILFHLAHYVSGVTNEGAPQSPPLAPSNLAAAVISPTQVNLSWVDQSGDETNFKVERCSGQATCTDFVEIATLPPGSVSYSNTGLSPNTNYRYRVRAANPAGFSAYSNTVPAHTPNA